MLAQGCGKRTMVQFVGAEFSARALRSAPIGIESDSGLRAPPLGFHSLHGRRGVVALLDKRARTCLNFHHRAKMSRHLMLAFLEPAYASAFVASIVFAHRRGKRTDASGNDSLHIEHRAPFAAKLLRRRRRLAAQDRCAMPILRLKSRGSFFQPRRRTSISLRTPTTTIEAAPLLTNCFPSSPIIPNRMVVLLMPNTTVSPQATDFDFGVRQEVFQREQTAASP